MPGLEWFNIGNSWVHTGTNMRLEPHPSKRDVWNVYTQDGYYLGETADFDGVTTQISSARLEWESSLQAKRA